jgi:acetyl esterase/lipase
MSETEPWMAAISGTEYGDPRSQKELLRRRGVDVEYVLLPEEGHGFRKAPNRVRSAVATIDWFRRHLLP